MTTSSISYGTDVTPTKTLAGLASDTNLLIGRALAAIDNTTERAVDYSVRFSFRTGTSPTAGRVIEVWAAPSSDGTNYAGGNGGSDAAKTHTAESKQLMTLVASIGTHGTSNTDYEINIPSLAGLLGGAMPRKCSFFAAHNTAVALNATEGSHAYSACPLHYTSA